MMNVQILANSANIAACLSLIIYLCGSLISGIISFTEANRFKSEIFIWYPNEKQLQKYDVVHNEPAEPDELSPDGCDSILIATSDVMINVKAYNGKYDYKKNNFFKKESIFQYNRLTCKECIVFRTILSESIPNTQIVWGNKDFMRAELVISYNGRNGNKYENISYHRTFKSFFFYIFKK